MRRYTCLRAPRYYIGSSIKMPLLDVSFAV